MYKSIRISVIIVIMIVVSSISAMAKVDYSLYDLQNCKTTIKYDNNSMGAYVYGFTSDTLYSAVLLPQQMSSSVKIKGKIRCALQSESITYAFYEIDAKKKMYGLVGIDAFSGKCTYYDFNDIQSVLTNLITISGDYVYFMATDEIYAYMKVYSINGDYQGRIDFGYNSPNKLFNNNGVGYAVCDNGEIYRFNGLNAEYVTKIWKAVVPYNVGVNTIVTGEGAIYSLDGSAPPEINIHNNKIIFTNRACAYESGKSLVLIEDNKYKFIECNGNSKFILGYENSIAVFYDDYSYLVIGFEEFPDNTFNDDNNGVKTASNNNSEYFFTTDGYIRGVENTISIKQFKQKFSEGVKIYDSNGEEVTSGNVRSGYILDIDNNSYIISVNGDLSGEGNIKSNDVSKLMDFFIGSDNLSDLQMICADYNFDGVIDNKDLVIIARIAEFN